jgi:hypothetical protein
MFTFTVILNNHLSPQILNTKKYHDIIMAIEILDFYKGIRLQIFIGDKMAVLTFPMVISNTK